MVRYRSQRFQIGKIGSIKGIMVHRVLMASSNRGRFCKPFLQSFTSPERQQLQRHNSILGLAIYVDAP